MESGKNIKVVLALRNYLLLQGFRMVLREEAGLAECGVAGTSEDLLGLAYQLQPDLVVIETGFDDFFAKDRSGFFKDNKVLAITELDQETIYQVHKVGISGFITVNSDAREIRDAIFATARGEKFFSPRIVEVLISQSFRHLPQQQEQLHESLSDREMEILRMVAAGRSTKDIAEVTGLSTHTVYTHRKNILKKLSCKNASELINYAYSQGLVEIP